MNELILAVTGPISILIGTPFLGGVCHLPYLLSMLRIAEELPKRGINYELFAIENESFLPRARAVIAHHFWKSQHTHLLFADADMGFRIQDLLAMLDSGHDIVAGVGPQKVINWRGIIEATADHAPTFRGNNLSALQRAGSRIVVNFKPGASLETDEQGCLEVLDAGTGFMLIRRTVVETIRLNGKLATFNGSDAMRGEKIVPMFDPWVEDGKYLTEDFAFCRRWQQLGGKVHVYVYADLEHVGNYTYRGNLLDHATVTPAESPSLQSVDSPHPSAR